MSSLTTRLKLLKPAQTDTVNVDTALNGNYDLLDALVPNAVCTSTTRPATPFEGMLIWETNTDILRVWSDNSSRWEQVNEKYLLSTDARPSNALLGDKLLETDTGIRRVWNGVRFKPIGDGNTYYVENTSDITPIAGTAVLVVQTAAFTVDGLTPFDIEGVVPGWQVPAGPTGNETLGLRAVYTLNAGADTIISQTFATYGTSTANQVQTIAPVKRFFTFPSGSIVVKLQGIRVSGGVNLTIRGAGNGYIKVIEK